ncbi:MAG: hypothetical protein EPO20_18125 [Betaproteobacteria bacterium]|nr:MAG: hypothetical protein EPO20_18125 [Betaproteobacteria bacterium]
MKIVRICAWLVALIAPASWAADGLITVKSSSSPNASGQVWIGYNDPEWIARRHEAPNCPAARKLKEALSGLVDAAAAK